MGVPEDQILKRRAEKQAAMEAQAERDRFEVFPANWKAVTLFLDHGFRALERNHMDGRTMGMRVEALEALLRICGEGQNVELFEQLLLIGDGVAGYSR